MSTCRYIFITREDDETLRLVKGWIERRIAADNDSASQMGRQTLFRYLPVDQQFAQACVLSDDRQWVTLESLKLQMDEKIHSSTEHAKKQEHALESCVHEMADSLPCIGCSLHVYIFLHPDDLDCDENFTPLAASILRLVQWHGAKSVIVRLGSELSANGHTLASLPNSCTLSEAEFVQSSPVTWIGEVSVMDCVKKDGVLFPGFCIHDRILGTILKEAFCPIIVKKCKKRGRKEQVESVAAQPYMPVFGHTIEVLQIVDLRTFPLSLLTPWTFNLHAFCNTSYPFVEYVQEKTGMGLVARLQVFPLSGEIPACGKTDHMTTSSWREHVMRSKSTPSSKQAGTHRSDTHIFRDNPPSKFEYLHMLILPSCTSSPSCIENNCLQLRVRVLLTSKQVARNILGVVRKLSDKESQCSQKSDGLQREKDEVRKCINSLPVFKDGSLSHTLKQLDQQRRQACENREGGDAERRRRQDSSITQPRCIVSEMPRTGQTVGDLIRDVEQGENEKLDGVTEAVSELSKCPEWIALMADSSGHSLDLESSFGSGRLSSTSTPLSRKDSMEKTGLKDFSLEHILSRLEADGASRDEGKARNFAIRRYSDSSSVESTDNNFGKRHDIYHYYTEKDFDSELKYAQIRDRGSFQDTQSSFVSPQKKPNRQFHPSLPTRSSPRSKLFSRKPVLSQPPKNSLENKPTFKQPQSVQQNSLSTQRKRPASSLTPDSEHGRPVKYSRTDDLCSPSSSGTVRAPGAYSLSPMNQVYKRVPFMTVPEPLVRRSPRKLPRSLSGFGDSARGLKRSYSGQSLDSSIGGQRMESTTSDQSAKMKRSERHMMRLKNIIASVLKEKGVKKGDSIYDACSKNLLNVSIILLKSLPNSNNLTDEMKSVVYGQVQQIINLEKRRSGIAL